MVEFLDMALDFCNNIYEPYRKPGNHPVYINENFNHPKTIFRDLPKPISKRLSDLSFTKKNFEDKTPMYSETLKKIGFSEHLVFTPDTNASDYTSKKTIEMQNN